MASLLSLLAGIGLAFIGASHAARTYLEHLSETTQSTDSTVLSTDGGTPEDTEDGYSTETTQAVLDRERVCAYREIMATIISLNRQVVEMDAMELQEEADLLVHGGDSGLDEAHAAVTQTYQSYFYIISPTVKASVSQYADYLVTHHDEGAQAGELLSRSGAVAEAMRADLGLEPLFEAPSNPESPDE